MRSNHILEKEEKSLLVIDASCMKSIDSKFESIRDIVRVRDDNTIRINKLRLDKNEYIDDLPKDVMNLVYKVKSRTHNIISRNW